MSILNRMKAERDILESKVWLRIPKVASHPDRPKVLVARRKTVFMKRIKSYNFVDIYAARMMYFWRKRILLGEYMRARYFFLLIKDFVEFLKKHNEDYLLLKDLCGVFQNQARCLFGEVSSAEEETGTVLGSRLFCE